MEKVFFILVVLFLLPLVLAVECPFGEIDCPYPGDCGRYVDVNGDELCDFSQDSVQVIEAGVFEGVFKDAKVGKNYYFMYLLIVTLVFYFITYFLAKIKKIRMSFHRKLWNFVLLITFFACAITGIFLVLRIQYGFDLPLGFNKLFWHVETGIVMAIVSVFHIFWHLNYFKSYFRKV